MQTNTKLERRAVSSLASLYIFRMLGLFMVLPVLVVIGQEYEGATPVLLGIALGVYGLTQAALQLPLGLLSDYIGRKPVIIGGLLVFGLGSVTAASANSIEWLIIGRALQGAGAIAAAIMALLTDLTTDQNRTKAMASVGASIGVAFALSLVLGPLIAVPWGLAGIFWVTAGLSVVGILVTMFIVPTPVKISHSAAQGSPRERIRSVLHNPQLVRLDIGVFILHMLMTALFVAVPVVFVEKIDLPVERHWYLYLPIMVIAFVAMVPFIIAAEKYRKMRPVFLAAIGALALSLLLMASLPSNLFIMALLLLLFFWGFNLLEASLPSLMSKMAPAGTKGAASGVYSTCQFLGAFVGGVIGGLLLDNASVVWVFVAGGVASGLWLAISWSMVVPKPTSNVLVTLNGQSFEQIVDRLRDLDGVVEVTYLQELSAASLRVDNDQFRRNQLQELGLS